MNIPPPDLEQLRPLLEAALAVMTPNDPARRHTTARACLPSDGLPFLTVSFYNYDQPGAREVFGSGQTADEALAAFKAAYRPPYSNAERAAHLRKQADELEAAQ